MSITVASGRATRTEWCLRSPCNRAITRYRYLHSSRRADQLTDEIRVAVAAARRPYRPDTFCAAAARRGRIAPSAAVAIRVLPPMDSRASSLSPVIDPEDSRSPPGSPPVVPAESRRTAETHDHNNSDSSSSSNNNNNNNNNDDDYDDDDEDTDHHRPRVLLQPSGRRTKSPPTRTPPLTSDLHHRPLIVAVNAATAAGKTS